MSPAIVGQRINLVFPDALKHHCAIQVYFELITRQLFDNKIYKIQLLFCLFIQLFSFKKKILLG